METLFIDDDGNHYSEDDVYHALLSVGADECETIFLHSDVVLGSPGGGFSRREYIGAFYRALIRLGVKNIIVPTFTYSFCNREIFDVKKSATSMGALNEYIRKLPGRYRTADPLLSLSVPEELRGKFMNPSDHSLGKGSGMDVLHGMRGVKFLFLGTKLYDSFTYLHYVECMRDVPYCFEMGFSGTVVDEAGVSSSRTQYIFTPCTGVSLHADERFADALFEKGHLKRIRLGNATVSTLSEEDAFREINDAISRDTWFFLTEKPTHMERRYSYDLSQGRITHC